MNDDLRKALELLKSVDFGAPDRESQLRRLEEASAALEALGLKSPDLELAIGEFTTNPDRAKDLIYGPTGRGNNRGALPELLDLANSVRYRQAVYRKIV